MSGMLALHERMNALSASNDWKTRYSEAYETQDI
jgi:hypothetical protein